MNPGSLIGRSLYHSPPRRIFNYTLTSSSEALDNSCTSPSNLVPISPSLQPHIQLSDPSTHPKRVLDIGCGVGHWVVNAASLWPNTTFVGLDLVAVQPDPFAMERIRRTVTREKERRNRNKEPAKLASPSSKSPIPGSEERDTVQAMLRSTTTDSDPRRKSPPSVSSSDSGSSFGIPANSIYRRIKWVHHNFLTKRLPFKDGEFDFVHIRGIAQGVPEDQVSDHIAKHFFLCTLGWCPRY
jgi:SAM-dependent methyltransferase